jgi:tRNA-2-methylthio-N6-dimethylallyladenosine synthase
MKFYIKTFGCQMNVHDSSRISELMTKNGHEPTSDPNTADVVVVNTCSVREKAFHKAVSETGRFCSEKRNKPGLIVVAAGCVAQQEGEKWFERLPNLDLVVGPDRYGELLCLIEKVGKGSGSQVAVGFDNGASRDFLSTEIGVGGRPVSAFVTVMKGCSESCSYCIVPSVRGPERCRPSCEIVDEANVLVDDGVREIILLGQKVNAYREEGLSFAGLLRKLDGLPGLHRLRFTSPHPRHMDAGLVELYGELETLCESIHLPAQSGSDRALKTMGRRYTAAQYRKIVEDLRKKCPEIAISTDLIVGFPGETEADFQETLRLIQDVRFAGVFSFKYSPRPGTEAAKAADDVPEHEKKRRLAEAHEVIAHVERAEKARLIGKRLEVLVEGEGRIPSQLSGRARNNQIINFSSSRSVKIDEVRGRFMEVEIVRALPHCLEGTSCTEGTQ